MAGSWSAPVSITNIEAIDTRECIGTGAGYRGYQEGK